MYNDSVYIIMIGCLSYIYNLGFKFKFELYVMHSIVKVYTLSMYRKLIHYKKKASKNL